MAEAEFKPGDLVRVGDHGQGRPFVVVAEAEGGYILGRRVMEDHTGFKWARGTEFFARRGAVNAMQ